MRQQPEYEWKQEEPPESVGYILPFVLEALDELPETALILDAGSGNGAVLGLVRARGRGWKLHGLEISESGLKQARRSNPEIEFEWADLTADLSGHPLWGRCEAVISLEVVEHVFLPRVFASNCYGFLKPGGLLVLSTPYHGYLKNLILAVTARMDTHFTALWDFGHIKFWSWKTLSVLLKEAEFCDIQFRGAGRFRYLWKSMVLSARKSSGLG